MSLDLPTRRGLLLVQLRKQTSCPKRVDFCKKYNISVPTMKAWESGTHEEISGRGIKRLVDAFQNEGISCDANYILNGQIDTLDLNLSNAQIVFNLKEISSIEKRKICTTVAENYNSVEFVRIINDTLSPFLNKDDIIVGTPVIKNKKNINTSPEGLSIIKTITGNVYVMFFEKTSLDNIFLLRSNNYNVPLIHLNKDEIISLSSVALTLKNIQKL